MNKKAFSISEILVTVLIISVLVGVGIPLYKHTVHKTKYNTLMLLAKTTANANEMYYGTHHAYTTNPKILDITIPNNVESLNLELVNDDDVSFVSVSRTDLPKNKYILYQKFSSNFPAEAHCEAEAGDADANWLCKQGLNGKLIDGSITPNYNTYVISGTGNGRMQGLAEVLTHIQCNDNENSGSKSCEVIVNSYSSVTKVSCTNKNNVSSCSYSTYKKDGSQSTCYGKAADYVEGECIANKKGSYMKAYDENGNLTEYLCNNYTSGSGCYALGQEQYDANGRHLAAQNRYCNAWNSNGECIGYKQGQGNNHFGIFSENHKIWVRADCQEVDINAVCNSYKGGRVEEWDYDDNGKTLVYHDNTCTSMSMDLVCSSYSKYKTKTYSYNADGSRTESTCESTFAENVRCKTTTTSHYNTNNKETATIGIACLSFGSDNKCTKYKPQSSSYKTYANDGKTLASNVSVICNGYDELDCTGGWTVTYTPYVNGQENKDGETVTTCQNFDIYQGKCLDSNQ